MVPNPLSYTIQFKTDNTFSAKADCNTVQGAYVTSAGNALTITPGPSTKVACGPGSLGDAFIAGLSASKSYEIKDGQLIISNVSGTMTFA